jgi:hypothetical protein
MFQTGSNGRTRSKMSFTPQTFWEKEKEGRRVTQGFPVRPRAPIANLDVLLASRWPLHRPLCLLARVELLRNARRGQLAGQASYNAALLLTLVSSQCLVEFLSQPLTVSCASLHPVNHNMTRYNSFDVESWSKAAEQTYPSFIVSHFWSASRPQKCMRPRFTKASTQTRYLFHQH